MAWLQLTLDSNRQTAERLSDLLQNFGAVSVSLSAASGEAIFGQDSAGSGALWEKTRIKALLHEDTDLDVLLPLLGQCAGRESVRHYRIDSLPEREWVNEYRQSHEPRVFGDCLCICPVWRQPPAGVQHVLMLDPGLAFGTGRHETTGLCLEWLAGLDLNGKAVIDYGCGSGILALSALVLGAEHAWAIDTDEQALAATHANAKQNNLHQRLTVDSPESVSLPQADVLVANILLKPLLTLAPQFAGCLCGGGLLAVSGILASQAEDCLAAYQSWFTMNPPVFNREWALLTGAGKPKPPSR